MGSMRATTLVLLLGILQWASSSVAIDNSVTIDARGGRIVHPEQVHKQTSRRPATARHGLILAPPLREARF